MTRPDTATDLDVVIVGAGPGGLFAALRAQRVSDAQLLVVDAGLDVDGRVHARAAQPDDSATITSGFGGAGLFSDGKLCLSHRIGSTVAHRFPAVEVERRQHAIDELIRSGEDAPLHDADTAAATTLYQRAAALGMEHLHYPIRHVGSDQLPGMLSRLRARIRAGAVFRCRTAAVDVVESDRPGRRWKVWMVCQRSLPRTCGVGSWRGCDERVRGRCAGWKDARPTLIRTPVLACGHGTAGQALVEWSLRRRPTRRQDPRGR